MVTKCSYEWYADAPLVRGAKDEFNALHAKGWTINNDYVWSRRVLKRDPPFFKISESVGSGDSLPGHGAKFWYFRTPADALRFERGTLRRLGEFDTSKLTAWQAGAYCGHYVIVGSRVMGTMHIFDPRDPSVERMFNVALLGEKGERSFRLAVGSGSFAVAIDAPIAKEVVPVEKPKYVAPDRDTYIAGYRQGCRDTLEQLSKLKAPPAPPEPLICRGDNVTFDKGVDRELLREYIDAQKSRTRRHKKVPESGASVAPIDKAQTG